MSIGTSICAKMRQLDGQWTYSVCILEGYSRKILVGMASEYQDEIAVLQLLTAALSEYGCPAKLVSDNGAVFTAHAYCGLLETLGIEACYIEKGQPWENLIEAQFLELWELDDEQWRKVLERAPRLRRARDQLVGLVEQLPLWLTGLLVLVLSRIISAA
jgi:transposase InsO family protein